MTKIVSMQDFDYEWFSSIPILKRPRGNQGSKAKVYYKNIITAFDIETSRLIEIEQSIMYIWQWQFGLEYTVIGRTWEEFTKFCERISNALDKDVHLCTYVHNLSYEFQFLKGIHKFSNESVFAIDKRKVLKATMYSNIELRCSLLHCNMSLAEYTKKMGCEHQKTTDLDYKIVRYPWTALTELELTYCVNDVLGLVEALTIEMELDEDTLYTIPLTSTGYVRRDTKKAMRSISVNYLKGQLPDYETYQKCREAFRGGNTHANRHYAGYIIDNVKSADRASSYTDVLCNCLFPVSAFFHAGRLTYEQLRDILYIRKKAVLMRVTMSNVRLRDELTGAPYLSRDKCRNIDEALYDNGRILSAKYLETTITDIDFSIILEQYDFDDFEPFDVSYARYGKLPKPIIDTTIEYFRLKTKLKGIDGEEIYYMKSKNKLNSIYGMMAQCPVKQNIEFIEQMFSECSEDEKDLLELHNKKAFLSYQWGVWTTAWARYRLEEGFRLAGDNMVYGDTDAVKYVGEIDWTEYNNLRIKESKESGAWAKDKNGKIHYMGVYESDGDYSKFSTLGAKKYCYVDRKSGKLCVTIAGVNKAKGAEELKAAGGIEKFKPGFIFKSAGGTEAVYNDFPEIETYVAEGRQINITSNVVLKDSTYTLGITAEYERILDMCHNKLDLYA